MSKTVVVLASERPEGTPDHVVPAPRPGVRHRGLTIVKASSSGGPPRPYDRPTMRLGTRKQATLARRAFQWPTDGKVLLHVGCGERDHRLLPDFLTGPEWNEVRFDIDPDVDPDVVGTIVDMVNVESESADALWSSHNLEHIFDHEVALALGEFHRVLRPGGTAYVQVPDLEAPAREILKGRLDRTFYESPAGPIRPLDMLYGLGSSIATGKHYMAHRCGFTRQTLSSRMRKVGFATVHVISKDYSLWATATRARES
jgi:SAM-dependent methyltransferase